MNSKWIKRFIYLVSAIFYFFAAAIVIMIVGHLISLRYGPSSYGIFPWDFSARHFYLYHARDLIQSNPDCVSFDSKLLYKPSDGSCRFKNFEFDTVITSKNGYRVNPYLEGSPELIILGDSFAQGWGVNDNETAAAWLTKNHKIQTLNYGVSSYGTAREMETLRRHLKNFRVKPKYIYIMYCSNDYDENIDYIKFGFRNKDPSQFNRLFANRLDPSLIYNYVRAYKFHADSIIKGFNNWRDIIPKGGRYSDLHAPASGITIENQIDAFKKVLEKNSDILEDVEILVSGFSGWGSPDEISEHLLRNTALPNGVRLTVVPIDLDPDAYYLLDGHLNQLGHQLVAGKLYEKIRTK